jgi:hypothetical protein
MFAVFSVSVRKITTDEIDANAVGLFQVIVARPFVGVVCVTPTKVATTVLAAGLDQVALAVDAPVDKPSPLATVIAAPTADAVAVAVDVPIDAFALAPIPTPSISCIDKLLTEKSTHVEVANNSVDCVPVAV